MSSQRSSSEAMRESVPSKSVSVRFAARLGIATLCRLVLNTARRFAYPFAPVLSRGLGVSIPAVTSMIAATQATGIVGVVLGPMADRLGYRRMMLAGLGMLAVGMLAAAFLPVYSVVFIGLVLAGLGKTAFDPAIQAYVSERVPFERRGLAIGVLEFSWAGSTLLGIPLLAILIDRTGWRSPFFVLGALGVIGIVAVLLFIPADSYTSRASKENPESVFGAFRVLLGNRVARGVLGFIFLVSLGNDNLFVSYGAWLEDAFQVNILLLGAITGAIGFAELLGEGLVVLISDRIGLKRAAIAGVVLCILSYSVLPLVGGALPVAMGGLFMVFLAFEFTVVSGISLSTEALPEYRATMMAAFFAAAGIGRILGALAGGVIWTTMGIPGIGLASAFFSALALLSLMWGMKGWHK